jgi:hypothetical protein
MKSAKSVRYDNGRRAKPSPLMPTKGEGLRRDNYCDPGDRAFFTSGFGLPNSGSGAQQVKNIAPAIKLSRVPAAKAAAQPAGAALALPETRPASGMPASPATAMG